MSTPLLNKPAADNDPQLEALMEGTPSFITDTTVSEDGGVSDFYKEHGYLVVPDALSAEELEELRAEALSICKGERGDVRGSLPNVPGESDEHSLPSQDFGGHEEVPGDAQDGRGAHQSGWPQRQVYAVDALH